MKWLLCAALLLVGCASEVETTLWPDGVVYYQFYENVPQEDRDRIRADMDVWESLTYERIIFVPSTSDNAVLIAKTQLTWAKATIGYTKGTDLYVNYYAYNSASIQHELGHVLGLQHEHQRYDRDSYITVYMDQVDSDRKNDYEKLKSFRFYDYADYPYDYRSIMHYANGGNLIAPEDLGGKTISVTDILKIENMYGDLEEEEGQ